MTKGALIASTAVLFPFGTTLALGVFCVGTLWFVIQLGKEYGPAAASTDPSRCPSCRSEELMRVQASVVAPPVPLLHCRACGEAYYWHAGSLIRDTGRPLF
jgi:hypothetical protein